MSAVTPRCSCSHVCPSRNCRAKDSPAGMFPSGSTQVPPTINQRPSATYLRILSIRSGCRSATQARCCTCEQANVTCGLSSITASALLKDRAALRAASRNGHNQAVSRCAFATACSLGASGAACAANNGASARPNSTQRLPSVRDRSSTTSHAALIAARPRAFCAGSVSSLTTPMARTIALAAASPSRFTRTTCARETNIRGAASGMGPRLESVGYQSPVGIGLAAASM